jgi:hypothetical protein|tara:strand:+ start:383 stop:526 length:144 start_codon:yes stop_codon:yes gene_type:complete
MKDFDVKLTIIFKETASIQLLKDMEERLNDFKEHIKDIKVYGDFKDE